LIYQFNHFTLDTDRFLLCKSDEEISTEPQVFDLLTYLITNRDRVVTRDELLGNLWKGKVVTDATLGARLKDARKAVGDSGTKQEIIKTFHGRGYQFIAGISEHATGESQPDNNLVKSDKEFDPQEKPSIAILLFANLSGDPAQQYFSEGMTTNICSQLSRIRSLQVKSGFYYEFGKTTLDQISEELGVDYVLRGSVLKENDRVKVFVELTDCKHGEIKWAESFDRRGNKIIDIQEEIATAITGSLWSSRGVIGDVIHENLSRKSTQDFNAFDCILKGVHYKEKFNPGDLLIAHEYFDKAKSLDPGSSEAFAWSAWAYIVDMFFGYSSNITESLNQAITEARHAISIDPFSEVGHWVLGAALVMDNDYERGFEEYDKAMEINPNNPDFMVTKGRDLAAFGRFDEGIELIHKGFEFNHHHAEWYFWYQGIAYFAANRIEDAIDSFSRLNHQNKDSRIYLAACFVQSGDLAEAQNQVTELLDIDPKASIEEIAATHSYLNAESRERLVGSVKLVMGASRPHETLRIV